MENRNANEMVPSESEEWQNLILPSELSPEMIMMMEGMAEQLKSKTKSLMKTVINYKELMVLYTCAMKTVKTKFEVLDSEFKVRYSRNPINSIVTRLKRTSGIAEKLARRNLPFTLDSIRENINDVAGVRVICSYVDDIYRITQALLQQEDITLLEKKDYSENPKPNGYRSLHLIVGVPVYFSDQKYTVKVEVQIRTIAMEFWASLEHQLKYKQNMPGQKEVVSRLKECADTIYGVDAQMQKLREEIAAMEDTPTEEDVLLEKLERLDIKID